MLETIRIMWEGCQRGCFWMIHRTELFRPQTEKKVKTDHLTITRLHHSLLELMFCCFWFFFFLQRASKPTLSGVLLWCKKWWSQGVGFSLWTVSKVICCKRKTAVSFWFGRCKWTLALKQVQYLRRKENEAWIPLASRKIIFLTKQITRIFCFIVYSMPLTTVTPFLQTFFWLEKNKLV